MDGEENLTTIRPFSSLWLIERGWNDSVRTLASAAASSAKLGDGAEPISGKLVSEKLSGPKYTILAPDPLEKPEKVFLDVTVSMLCAAEFLPKELKALVGSLHRLGPWVDDVVNDDADESDSDGDGGGVGDGSNKSNKRILFLGGDDHHSRHHPPPKHTLKRSTGFPSTSRKRKMGKRHQLCPRNSHRVERLFYVKQNCAQVNTPQDELSCEFSRRLKLKEFALMIQECGFIKSRDMFTRTVFFNPRESSNIDNIWCEGYCHCPTAASAATLTTNTTTTSSTFEYLTEWFFRMDTYSKCITLTEAFLRYLDGQKSPVRLCIDDLYCNVYSQIIRSSFLKNKDSEGGLSPLPVTSDMFLLPVTDCVNNYILSSVNVTCTSKHDLGFYLVDEAILNERQDVGVFRIDSKRSSSSFSPVSSSQFDLCVIKDTLGERHCNDERKRMLLDSNDDDDDNDATITTDGDTNCRDDRSCSSAVTSTVAAASFDTSNNNIDCGGGGGGGGCGGNDHDNTSCGGGRGSNSKKNKRKFDHSKEGREAPVCLYMLRTNTGVTNGLSPMPIYVRKKPLAWPVHSQLLFPVIDNTQNMTVKMNRILHQLKLKPEIAATLFTPGLFKFEGQFRSGVCIAGNNQKNKKTVAGYGGGSGGGVSSSSWTYSLADYSPLCRAAGGVLVVGDGRSGGSRIE